MELRLIVKASQPPPTLRSLTLAGRLWYLTEALDVSRPENIPQYICVSYIWGSGRVPNPLYETSVMSDQTLPALVAAMGNSNCSSFWIDAFCIPLAQPQRRATLESMGFIYSQASQVVVSLSETSFAAVKQMVRSDRVDENALNSLDQDEWVRSVWTYQEVVNSKRLSFVTGNVAGAIVDGSHFLNCVGYSLDRYKKSHACNPFDIRRKFAGLDALEDLIEDWHISSYTKRSAFQVMSNLDRRYTAEPQNYFYSMIGAISQTPSARTSSPSITELSETFMRICEEKSDYSFLYSTAARDERLGRRWRPIPGHLHSLLPWGSWGESQPGHYDSQGFWLDNMLRFEMATTMNELSKQKIPQWLHQLELLNSDIATIAEKVYQNLCLMGFSGSSAYILTEDGLFFPQKPLLGAVDVTILVSASIQATYGGPGLAKAIAGKAVSYTPGILAGTISKERASSILIEAMPGMKS